MGIFGWSLPPGVSYRDIDPPESPCAVCGQFEDKCICPECATCSGIGDPVCYEQHGMVRTPEQIESLKAAEAEWAADNASYPSSDDWDEETGYWKEGSK